MRSRKLYLSELILRLDETSTVDIKVTYHKLAIEWFYTSKQQAIKDLIDRPLWNCQVIKYRIKKRELAIIINE